MSDAAESHARDLLALVGGFDPAVAARGRQYAAEGRVQNLQVEPGMLRATVRGSAVYGVSVERRADGSLRATCSCLAFARDGACKHLAALTFVLLRSVGEEGAPAERRSRLQAATTRAGVAMPALVRTIYGSAAFLARLGLYDGEAPIVFTERWTPLLDWWHDRSTSEADRARVARLAPRLLEEVAALARWMPPETPLPGTIFGNLYARLASLYVARREYAALRGRTPGPRTGHPGFTFTYDARMRDIVVEERRTPLLPFPGRLALALPLDPHATPRFEDSGLTSPTPDAWDLFALAALLDAMHARTDPGIVEMARVLGLPVWEHVLERLGTRAPAAPQPREWAFVLGRHHGGFKSSVHAFARRPADDERPKPLKWKRESFERLYDEATTSLEREIARVAMCSLARVSEANLELGTAQGHELLRLLAQHPRVATSPSPKPDPDGAAPAQIAAGDLSMRMDPDETGALRPRFFVGAHEVAAGALSERGSSFRTLADDDRLVSAFVPRSLEPWLTAGRDLGESFAFPADAVPRVAAATLPLVDAGVAELPRSALGEELQNTPKPALRVSWQPGGDASVEIFVEPHPGAPLVAPGLGPTLLTFERPGGARAYVERDLAGEVALAESSRGLVGAPLLWTGTVGHTESIHETLALADWLERNPHGLTVEVKIGRTPRRLTWENAKPTLTVKKRGSWLVLDGALDAGGVTITLGDVLEAARLASRYVRAENGVFLELSKEAVAQLEPVAYAAELAREGTEKESRVHEAFGALVAQAGAAFAEVRGLEPYVAKLAARKTRVKVPPLDHGTLRPYQTEGAAWMLQLASWAPGCVLADDMGLGKTVQTAAVLKARHKLGPALIVAPASVTSNWVAELARFVPSLTTRWFNDDRTSPDDLGPGDVLVASYGLLQRRAEEFARITWATVVVDEAQYVKNVAARRTDAVRSLPRSFTIALTGTPLENHLGELFSIVDLAFEGLLGSERAFRERFRRPIEGSGDPSRLAALGRLIAPFLLRRKRSDVLRELPPREEITELVTLGPEEQRRYLALRKACEAALAKRKRGETSAQLKVAVLAALTRLRQLACDVRLVDPSYEGESTKVSRAVELATAIVEEKNQVLVFSSFTQFLDRLRPALEAAGLRVGTLQGDTPTTKRAALVDAFQAGTFDVFCVSLLAGGTGLNLTAASYVIHTDPWWNPAAEEQATSRAHRMGQTAPVTVYRLVAKGTIEEAVLAMHATKKALAASVLDGKDAAKNLSTDELLALLRFGDEE